MRDKRYYVYIMASKSRVLYTGVTNDIYSRALQHKSGEVEGFTKRYKINRLVYYEEFTDVGAAIAREKQIKGLDRAKRVALIESENPTWDDLAEDWGKKVPMTFDPGRRQSFALSGNDQPVSDSGKATEKQIPRRFAPRDDSSQNSVENDRKSCVNDLKAKV